ncbi:hypothetical protein BH10PLA2_BH10PLA2_03620 [soil metagenome]
MGGRKISIIGTQYQTCRMSDHIHFVLMHLGRSAYLLELVLKHEVDAANFGEGISQGRFDSRCRSKLTVNISRLCFPIRKNIWIRLPFGGTAQ